MPRLLGMDLRGHLDLMLLATLRDDGPAHGYAIIASLRERSLGAFDLPEGTAYPALYRLERDGLVGSEWDASAARRRRVYSLTPAGARALAAKRRDWRDFARGMRAVLGPCWRRNITYAPWRPTPWPEGCRKTRPSMRRSAGSVHPRWWPGRCAQPG